MKRVLAVINPQAGRGLAKGLFEQVTEGLAGRFELETIVEGSAEGAQARLHEALSQGSFDRLIAVGGDGTGRLAAGALLETGTCTQTPFGLVPTGTGSDFVRFLEPNTKPEDRLARLLLSEATRACDLTEARTSSGERLVSLNIASAGLSSAVNEKMNSREQHGSSSYLLLTLAALVGYKPYACRVHVDSELLFDGPLFLVAIANSRFFGKGMMVAPEAEIDDGELDVVIVPPIPKWKLPWRLPKFLSGKHLRYPEVLFRRGTEVRFEPSPQLPSYDLDGDSFPAQEVVFRCLPRVLRLVV